MTRASTKEGGGRAALLTPRQKQLLLEHMPPKAKLWLPDIYELISP
jgi:hypothetical protein